MRKMSLMKIKKNIAKAKFHFFNSLFSFIRSTLNFNQLKFLKNLMKK